MPSGTQEKACPGVESTGCSGGLDEAAVGLVVAMPATAVSSELVSGNSLYIDTFCTEYVVHPTLCRSITEV